jgi:hypothetical protein
MKRKLFVAALAIVGGCDHRFGIGALAPDAGVAISGQEAGVSAIDKSTDAQTPSVGGTDARNLFPGEPWVGFLGPTTWTGHVEGYQFPSGSNTIRLALTADSLGRVAGMVLLGDGPPPPLFVDPSLPYPPDYLALAKQALNGIYWAEGFVYSMVSGVSEFSGLSFNIQSNELWSEWCARQTPVDASDACLPNWPGEHIVGADGATDRCYQRNPADRQEAVVDCGDYDLCITNHVCMCSTASCVFDQTGYNVASFTLSLPNNLATGTDYGIANDPANNTATGNVGGLFGNNLANVDFTQDL